MAAEENSGPGVPKWIVTFADLSTLMLTFFVLLISFSNQDVVKFREMLGSVQGAFGADEKREGTFKAVLTGNAAKEQKKLKEDKEKEEAARVKKQFAQVKSTVARAAKAAQMDDQTEVSQTGEGVRIRIKGGAIFAPGQVRISKRSVRFLKGVARALKKSNLPVIVEGHTDNQPIHTARIRSNWELSAKRASAVARYLIKYGGVPAKNVMAVGYADMRPLVKNDTPENRAKNRRVEFIVKR